MHASTARGCPNCCYCVAVHACVDSKGLPKLLLLRGGACMRRQQGVAQTAAIAWRCMHASTARGCPNCGYCVAVHACVDSKGLPKLRLLRGGACMRRQQGVA